MIERLRVRQFLSVEALCWAIFLLALAVVIIARLRLVDIPLERDEGEYAYTGQLLLEGVPPYKLAYSMKLPGTTAFYALFMAIFGQTIKGIHLGFLIINLAAIILIFLISKRLAGGVSAAISAASYALLSIAQSVLGVQAHATHFVVFMSLCGLFFLLQAAENENKKYIFLSGLFFGLAFLMKQQGIFFVLFGIFYLLWSRCKKQPVLAAGLVSDSAAYLLGAALPFIATCLAIFLAGVFDKFWFLAFQYASGYSSGVHGYAAFKICVRHLLRVIQPFQAIWYIAGLGLACLLLDPKARKNLVFGIALLAASFLTVSPGLIFREHYFVTLLPVVCILAGIAINSASGFLQNKRYPGFLRFVPAAVFSGLLLSAIFQQRHYLFEATPIQVSRESYGANPFAESIKIADYLKANSSAGDTIAVLGSEPQIYFYAHRRSATGYIYTYPLMEKQPYALTMQKEMTKEIESSNPRYLVFVNVNTSWLRRAGSEDFIFRWAKEYIAERYTLVETVAISKQPPASVLLYKLSTG